MPKTSVELEILRRIPSRCGAVIREIVPPPYQQSVFSALARSIGEANAAESTKWGLRLNYDSVMLKVGFNEVWQCGRDWVQLLALRQDLPRTIADADVEIAREPYSHAAGCDSLYMPYAVFPPLISIIQSAHHAAIRKSATARRHTSTVHDHSPGLVAFLARETGIDLPQPAHIGRADIPEEIPSGEIFEEGAATQILVNRFERDRKARTVCLRHYGARCVVCDFSFGDCYGVDAEGFIHIHHLTPLAEIGEHYAVDPIRDLRPVCPNCHAVIHTISPPRTIEEMKQMVLKTPRR